jgi:hypothetical protein
MAEHSERKGQRLAGTVKVLSRPLSWLGVAVVLALSARLYRLGEPALRWDEGWSLAHASLPWVELWRIASEEWHPPLYVALLKLWLVLGKSAVNIRALSMIAGVAAVPLTYAVARLWSERPRVAALAALFAALWPLSVYYGQVARMYALAALPALAAAWFILRDESNPHWSNDLGLLVSTVLGLYTLYYTVWALGALWAYAALRRPRRSPRLLLLGLLAVVAYVPWLWAARETVQTRVSAGAAAGSDPITGTWRYLRPTLQGLVFAYKTRGQPLLLLAGLLGLGLLVGPWKRGELGKLILPGVVILVNVVGVAYGSQAARWFAPRYLVTAAPFLGLALAWSLDRLAQRWWPALPAALLVLGLVYAPTSTRFVYEKTLEVVDPFDPAADHTYLRAHAAPGDLVYFNVLAKAGWYENLRGEQDPRWSYAMRWDPIIEPMERIAGRIERDAASHPRLWFVLYQGTYGPNAPLKAWLDATLYSAGGEWQGDTLYLAYAYPGAEWQQALPGDRFENGISLREARWTPQVAPGGACVLELAWETKRPLDRVYKVFIHVVDESGTLVGQHDAVLGTDGRPANTWAVGETVRERHGLFISPAAQSEKPLRLLVGLYDGESGQRIMLVDGGDVISLATVELRPQ